MSNVNVYESEFCNEIVARVKYNEKLDYCNGRNWGNGGLGMHKGITKLKDGRFVIIIGSQMQGSKDYAYIVSKEEALQEVLESGVKAASWCPAVDVVNCPYIDGTSVQT